MRVLPVLLLLSFTLAACGTVRERVAERNAERTAEAADPASPPARPGACERAAAYSSEHDGVAVLVMRAIGEWREFEDRAAAGHAPR